MLTSCVPQNGNRTTLLSSGRPATTAFSLPKWSWTLLLYLTASTEKMTLGLIWLNRSSTPCSGQCEGIEQCYIYVHVHVHVHNKCWHVYMYLKIWTYRWTVYGITEYIACDWLLHGAKQNGASISTVHSDYIIRFCDQQKLYTQNNSCLATSIDCILRHTNYAIHVSQQITWEHWIRWQNNHRLLINAKFSSLKLNDLWCM